MLFFARRVVKMSQILSLKLSKKKDNNSQKIKALKRGKSVIKKRKYLLFTGYEITSNKRNTKHYNR